MCPVLYSISLVVVLIVTSPVKGELFTSSAHLQSAVYAERDIAATLSRYIQREERRLRELKRVAHDLTVQSQRSLGDPDVYMGNPVNAFLFVKRFTTDWDAGIKHLLDPDWRKELLQRIADLRQFLPTTQDLQGSAVAIVRLQMVYKLKTADIARGNVSGVQTTPLSAQECFVLGNLCCDAKEFVYCVSWLEQALEMTSSNGLRNVSLIQWKIYNKIVHAKLQSGLVRQALKLARQLLVLDPTNPKLLEQEFECRKLLSRHYPSSKWRPVVRGDGYDDDDENGVNYAALCRGEDVKTSPRQHKLKCRLRTKRHPLLILSPAKEEVVHEDPFLAVYHDVFSASDSEAVTRITDSRLERASVQDFETENQEYADYRICKSAWLFQESDPLAAKLYRKVSAITGLNMETTEELQVANYGIGGHYAPHIDHSDTDKYKAFGDDSGNRIATFMFYLSDVEAGGGTVFPLIGAKIFPEKGSAVFWYNLYRNGSGIGDTLHGGCPVLLGSKWVGNVWIHERGQEFTRPCGLSEHV